MRARLLAAATIVGFSVAGPISVPPVEAQTFDVALTVDDLPWSGPAPANDQVRTANRRILDALEARDVPAVGFVVCDAIGGFDDVLHDWLERGHRLGNHTASHPDLNGTNPNEWIADAERCHGTLADITNPVFFRYPMLHRGNTVETYDAVDAALRRLGYQVAPVTIDNSEWVIASQYRAAAQRDDRTAMRELGPRYVSHLRRATDHARTIARARFGRDDYVGEEGLSWLYRIQPAQPALALWDEGEEHALRIALHAEDAETAGLDEATVDTVERLLVETMAEARIPGLSAAIVVDGRLAWSGGFGVADLENNVPATATTAYRTASIGKTMTATAVMQLVEQGRVDLDAPVQRYCPAFAEKRWPVTTRHLLGHTSGIRHYGGPNEEEELFNTVHYESVVAALDIFKDDSLLFEPGTAYQYSTFGYNVLGCVVEGASGQDFLSYMQEHVFEPAGMGRTRDDDPAALIPNRAEGYVLTESGELRNSRPVDMSSKMPAGGFITTAEDLARFAIAVMDHRLVRAETFEQMITPVVLRNGEPIGHGLGWGLFPGEEWYGEREAFHGGVTPQVSGMLYLLPDRRFAVAILMNLESVPGRTQLAADIAKVVLGLGR